MTQQEVFIGPKLKVKRAKRHFKELQSAVDAFFNRKPYRFVTELNPDTGENDAKIRVHAAIPMELATIIGDVVHNLRSALDLLAVDLARMNGHVSRTALNETYFPISANRQVFKTKGIGKIKRLNPAAQKLICDLKPYKGGNDALWILHKLDILDKHTLLVPAATVFLADDFAFGFPHTGEPDFRRSAEITVRAVRKFPLEDGDIFLSFPNTAEAPATIQIKPTFSIAFGKGQIAEGESVIPTLLQIGELVSGIVGRFDRKFSPRPRI